MLTALQNPPTPFLRLFSLFFPEVYLAMAAQSLCLLFRYISFFCSPTNALFLYPTRSHWQTQTYLHAQTQKHKRTHKHKNTLSLSLSLFHSLTSHRQMTAAQLSIFIRVFAYVNMGVYVYLLIRLKLRTQIEKKRVA